MQRGLLALPFYWHSDLSWSLLDALPIAICMLCQDEHQGLQQPLHKAEQISVSGFTAISQQCRSWRYAAEVTSGGITLVQHSYFGMGLAEQHRFGSQVRVSA